MNHDDSFDDRFDGVLSNAADDVRVAFDGDVPPFVPNRSASPVMGVIAAAILVAGGLWTWSALQADPATRVDTAVPIETTITEPITSEGETTESSAETTGLVITGFPTDLDARELVPIDRPAQGESIVDPAFGSTITRVTNATGDGRIVPVHSPASAWNAGESLILLYAGGGDLETGYVVYDAESFDEVRRLEITANDIEQVFWDPTNSDTVMFSDGAAISAISVSTGEISQVALFDGCATVDVPGGSSGPAWDGSLIVVTCTTDDGSLSVRTFEPDTGAMASRDLAENELGHAAPSGDAVIIRGLDGFTVLPPSLVGDGSTFAWQASGPTLTVAPDGSSLIVASGYENEDVGSIVVTTLDGDATVIVGPDTGYPFPPSGTQVIGAGWRSAGLVAAASPIPSDGVQGPIEGELIVADLRGDSPVVHRLAHTRSSGASYFAGSFLSISPSGRQVLFSSDWGGGPIDTYVIELDS